MKVDKRNRLFSSIAAAVALIAVIVGVSGCRNNVKRITPLPAYDVEVLSPEPASPFGIVPRTSTGAAPRRGVRSAEGEWDELWVISRNSEQAREAGDRQQKVGTGELLTKVEEKEVPLPLRHTEVRASVHGYIGSVNVRQEFENPYDTKIEAVYVFPLPHNAAVNEFVMTIGSRRIRGVIRERKEAERIYAQARRSGHVTSLLTQERANVFRQSVANIEPGRRIDVTIRYFHTLAYVDGWYEFVFPMVVGPRYNPPGSRDGIDAVSRGNTGRQPVAVPYLRPDERSGHDIALRLDIDAGVVLEEVACNTHQVTQSDAADGSARFELKASDRIPNKDFVLRYRVAGERIKSSFVSHRDERGGFFSMMLFPPKGLERLQRAPLELVFVLDCSGSMAGRPIEQAKSAIRHALHQLDAGDSFQIINFSESASALGRAPLEATPTNVRRGLAYLDRLKGDGGTRMIEGIEAALDFPHDPERLRFVCFLTDGYIGNEREILGAIHEKLGESRIFSFGVGSSPNRYLMDHMAKMGRGAVAYLNLKDDGASVMDDFFTRIRHPALTDIRIDWGGLEVHEVQPGRTPDLFVGRPVIITGRYKGEGDTTIRVSGKAGGQRVVMTLPVKLNGDTVEALPAIWARAKMAELADRMTYHSSQSLEDSIRELALDYGLMSSYTAFIATDSSRRTEGDAGVTVPVAVPVPDGVRYDTTVRE